MWSYDWPCDELSRYVNIVYWFQGSPYRGDRGDPPLSAMSPPLNFWKNLVPPLIPPPVEKKFLGGGIPPPCQSQNFLKNSKILPKSCKIGQKNWFFDKKRYKIFSRATRAPKKQPKFCENLCPLPCTGCPPPQSPPPVCGVPPWASPLPGGDNFRKIPPPVAEPPWRTLITHGVKLIS